MTASAIATNRRRATVVVLAAVVALAIPVFEVAWWAQSLNAAHDRLGPGARKQLAPTPKASQPRNILVLGTDRKGRAQGTRRADSIMVIRVDPRTNRVAMLSIPRNLAIKLKGIGLEEASRAIQHKGVSGEISAISDLVGLPIHHVVIGRFSELRSAVASVGGVEVENPYEVRWERRGGKTWTYPKGTLHLEGERALGYARVRTNPLNDNESDSSRTVRQQQLLRSIIARARGGQIFLHPHATAKTISGFKTDIGIRDVVAMRSSLQSLGGGSVLQCRLGGTFTRHAGRNPNPFPNDPLKNPGRFTVGRGPIAAQGIPRFILSPNEQNPRVVAMFTGTIKPAKLSHQDPKYPAGCASRRLT